MREILFRGKRPDNGEWVEGSLFIPDLPRTPTQICMGTNVVRISYDVLPETVSEFTGLTDKNGKNGKKIFEGDIVQSIELKLKGVIIFDEYCRFMIKDIATKCTYLLARNNEEIEVIGNIHDNPELLKGGDE